MRRLIPTHFRRDGQPKQPLTKEQAQAKALKDKKNAYRCKFCGEWHVGGRA